jgi:hypothetical protein
MKQIVSQMASQLGCDAGDNRPTFETVVVNGKKYQYNKFGNLTLVRENGKTIYEDIGIIGSIPIDEKTKFEIVRTKATKDEQETTNVTIRKVSGYISKKDNKPKSFFLGRVSLPMDKQILSLIAKHLEELSGEAS